MVLNQIEVDTVVNYLRNLGYAIVRTPGDSGTLMLAANDLGRLIGARSFGYVHLKAQGSPDWRGRHTESLTDGPTPLRYFALGCLVPAMEGGATHLYDGAQAARPLAGHFPGAGEVHISYRSAHRPEVSSHP